MADENFNSELMSLVHSMLGDNLDELKHIASGAFRDVYEFEFRRRKYALKIDRVRLLNDGCLSEARRWKDYENKPIGQVLAPVIVSGSYTFYNGTRNWLVMRKLNTIARSDIHDERFIKSIYRLMKENLFKRLAHLSASASMDEYKCSVLTLKCNELGNDLHIFNWGRDNRGSWLLIDYAGNF